MEIPNSNTAEQEAADRRRELRRALAERALGHEAHWPINTPPQEIVSYQDNDFSLRGYHED